MEKKQEGKMDVLVAFYIFCIICSELMGGKTFSIINSAGLQLNASVAIFLMPIIFSINDVVTEVFGAERTRGIVRLGIVVVFFLTLYTAFATYLPPSSRFLKNEKAYDLIFKQSIRISIASLIAFSLSDLLDVMIFVNIRKALGKRALWLRVNVSNFIAQFIDTFVFMVLAFYAVENSFNNNAGFLFSIILPYWLLKCFMSTVETPLVYLGIRWLKNK